MQVDAGLSRLVNKASYRWLTERASIADRLPRPRDPRLLKGPSRRTLRRSNRRARCPAQHEPLRTKEQRSFTDRRATSGDVLLLLSLASAVADAPAARPTPTRGGVATVTATATVRVLRGVARASESDWQRTDPRQQSELLIKEKDGRTTRLRLIEYQ